MHWSTEIRRLPGLLGSTRSKRTSIWECKRCHAVTCEDWRIDRWRCYKSSFVHFCSWDPRDLLGFAMRLARDDAWRSDDPPSWARPRKHEVYHLMLCINTAPNIYVRQTTLCLSGTLELCRTVLWISCLLLRLGTFLSDITLGRMRCQSKQSVVKWRAIELGCSSATLIIISNPPLLR